MSINIKKSNYWILYDFASGQHRSEMQGTKLAAVYKLIQKKGEPMQCKDNETLHGVKALQISDCEHIAMIRTSFNNKGFYPCKLKTILLTCLNDMA